MAAERRPVHSAMTAFMLRLAEVTVSWGPVDTCSRSAAGTGAYWTFSRAGYRSVGAHLQQNSNKNNNIKTDYLRRPIS